MTIPCNFNAELAAYEAEQVRLDELSEAIDRDAHYRLTESMKSLTWDDVLDCLNELGSPELVRLRAIMQDPHDTRLHQTDIGNVRVPGNLTAFLLGTAILEAVVAVKKTRAMDEAENAI